MNYFEFYPGDYLRDTTELNLTEHGAYLRLLIAYYSKEKPLPADAKSLYQITCAISAADKAATRRVADEFFPIANDGFRHKNRVDEEIAKAQKRIKIAQENGSRGGRKQNPSGNPLGIPPASPDGASGKTQRGARRHTQSGEALHTPHAIYQTPEEQELRPRSEPDASETLSVEGSGRAIPPSPAEVCIALKELGVVRIASSYAPLHDAIREGVTLDQILRVAKGVKPHQLTLEYIVAAARGKRADLISNGQAQEELEQQNHAVAERWAQQQETSEEDDDATV